MVGDWYLDNASGAYYEKTGASTWTARGSLLGPQGATGSTGSQGPQGTPGAPGSVWRSGSSAPAGGLGVVGDWYLNDTNGDVYEKTASSTWTLRDNLMGPQGATGAQGVKGDTGATGSQGPAGPSGASTFVSGTGAPTAGVGVDGAIYLDTASSRLWGPKAAGAWPGTALARVVPLAPTYAQLKAG